MSRLFCYRFHHTGELFTNPFLCQKSKVSCSTLKTKTRRSTTYVEFKKLKFQSRPAIPPMGYEQVHATGGGRQRTNESRRNQAFSNSCDRSGENLNRSHNRTKQLSTRLLARLRLCGVRFTIYLEGNPLILLGAKSSSYLETRNYGSP